MTIANTNIYISNGLLLLEIIIFNESKKKKAMRSNNQLSIEAFKFNKEIVGVNSPFPYSVGKPAPGPHRFLQYLRLLL